jgi:hypothetical protein
MPGVMRGVYGLVVLTQESGAFLLGQVAENGLGVIRILTLDRFGRHANTRPIRQWLPASARVGGGSRCRLGGW